MTESESIDRADTSTTLLDITDAQAEHYVNEGYCVLPSILPASLLSLLVEECDRAVNHVHAEMDVRGVNVLGGSRRGLQYTPGNCRASQPRLREFLHSDLMQAVCKRLIGSEGYLIWEQFSVKIGSTSIHEGGARFERDGNPQSLGYFSWHQDSGYVPRDHAPYLSCWIALDDITTENGALSVIPFPELGIRTRVTHIPEPHNGDLVGYFGSLPGVRIEVPRGSIICFSSTLFHSSAQNHSEDPRRAYLAQYGTTIRATDGGVLWHEAEPLSP